MSNVSLPIGGRMFAVSCADGEESHIQMLGRMVDERAKKIGGGQTETRMLLFAALMLADELHDAHNAAPAPQAAAQPAAAEQPDTRIVERVNALAARIEKLAATLEQGPVSA